MIRSVLFGALLAHAVAGRAALPAAPSATPAATVATPAAAIAAAAPGDWRRFAADDLLVLDFPDGGRVVVALAPGFAPVHVANIRRLARGGWFNGTAVVRVQDDYVTQWGDPAGRAPPVGVVARPPAEYDRPAAGLAIAALPYPDAYAPVVGAAGAFPVAAGEGRAWLAHCYAMVGVGRDLAPDTGSGAELYAVIGQAPRALDRNIALVGRVVAGMEHLAALPRGTGDLGFYTDPRQRVPFARVALAADLPAAGRPAFEWLDPASPGYARWVAVRAARHDPFFGRPAHGLDLCNALPPVRAVAAE